MSITLLGPQRRPALGRVVQGLELDGPFATINAGWQERESDDREFDEQLGGRSTNLLLWQRMQQVFADDADFAAAHRKRRAVIDQMQELYLIGVGNTLRAIGEIRARRELHPEVRDLAVTDAQEVLRSLDARHIERVQSVHGEFYTQFAPHERGIIAHHRGELRAMLESACATVIAGGHVAELLDAMHLFAIGPALAARPIVAWSAGAMTLTDRVVLFNDRASRQPNAPEVYDGGLGVLPGIVVFPSARQRLATADSHRMSLLAQRFAPAVCLPLDPGSHVTFDDPERIPLHTKVITLEGEVQETADA